MDYKPQIKHDLFLDTIGESCPMPVIHAQNQLSKMIIGSVLCVASDDRGVLVDFPAWCQANKQDYIGFEQFESIYYCYIRKMKPSLL